MSGNLLYERHRKLHEVPWWWVANYLEAAKAEKVCLLDDKDTVWFAYIDQTSLDTVGVCGYDKFYRRIRGIFLRSEYRGSRIGEEMTIALINHIETIIMPDWYEVWVFKPNIYYRHGFDAIGTRHTGTTICRKRLVE